ncbi:tannase/feruloyl esterase family alpha/beta hydrolase [Bradyrhizobium prioriisuperbiae]|uniref:tannase/feruloyl esterase family alpha/beta hydrolase n=1 Tax=Bradyrhizobium prioriisuperbiae TaxID=2854389 RepID=UPI0028EAFDFB|nr:tannase/feruloyl esterase family alpha/beta hydrolase [Bradyrhizobium prioritasuperba]
MKRLFLASTILIGWVYLGSPATASPLPVSGVAPRSSCTGLANLTLPNTQILNATQKPGYCNVIGIINKRISTQDPNHFTYGIGFALNLPNTWHGRFEMMGGGGTDGSLQSDPQGAAGVELGQGWAVAANDGGHEDSAQNMVGGHQDDDPNAGGTAHFAIDAQARRDYGYNGIEKTATISKQIISSYYGLDTVYSYIMGCSNGGRDAMVASQRFPWLFDGVISQNPGFNLPQAGLAEAWNEQVLGKLATKTDVNGQPFIPDTFPSQDLQVASAAILGACDALDGLVDGIIDNYHTCTAKKVFPALASYTCGTGTHGSTPHGGTCLTSAQVSTLKKIYAGPTDSRGRRLYSNWFWDAGIWTPPTASGAGWAAWNVVTAPVPGVNTAINLTLGAGALPMIFQTPPAVTPVNGPTGQEAFVFHFNFDTDAPKIFARTRDYPESAMDFMAAVSANLHPFRARGGKLIISSSVNDGIFSGAAIARWYRKMNQHMGGRAGDFARLFMVPNMAHCGGGAATTSFAENELKAITNWVEKDIAPERIVAANTNTASPYPVGGLFDPRIAMNFPTGGTRPLCAYPKISTYKGKGMTNDAANFACVDPQFRSGGDHDFDDDDDGRGEGGR